jgi:pimeloyl-ACP methyl ester carboxylesterase
MLVNNGGVRISYEVEGSGPAIIMRTGAGGDSRIWRDAGYVAGLPGYRKILIDQRGRGMSDRPMTLGSHRYASHISDIKAVLDDAGVESAAFMGYSAGATMGVAFGSTHPKRLKALVGMGSLPFYNISDQPKPADPDAEIRRIVAAGGVRAEYEEAAREEGGRFPEAIERNVLEGDPLMRALDFVASRMEGWQGPLDVYSALRFPVLMSAGELEDTDHETEKSVSKIPNARLVRLPGVGHLSSFYRSDLTLPHILPFLRRYLG